MKIAKSIMIVEDEPLIAADIASILNNNGYQVAGKVDSSEAALEKLKSISPDLLLLDVKIEGNIDGIALAHQVRLKYSVPHIFLTSFYDETTLARARETSPQGYIVKPFEERDLLINVGLALHKRAETTLRLPVTDKFFIRNNQDMLAVDVKDILYVQADDNYATLYTTKQNHIVSHTLKSVEEKLTPQGFIRVHRSYLINFQKITSIRDGYIYIDFHKVPLGNSYREGLIKQLSFL
jgi:DNA-binding LytR/AlgR family response regulator